MPRSATSALAALGGALLAVSFVVDAAWPAVFAAVATFVVCLETSTSRRQAISRAALFGWAAYVGGYYWVQPTLVLFWDGKVALSWVVWLVWGSWMTLRFVVIGWLYRALRQRHVAVLASLTLPWLTVEWLYPALFPFYLSNVLVERSWLAQSAALGGPLLPSAWVCMVSALAAQVVLRLQAKRPVPLGALATVLVATAALILYGSLSIREVERQMAVAPALEVGVIQANVDVMDKRTERILSHRRYAEQSKRLESESPVDMLIWPETSYLRAFGDRLPMSGAALHEGLRAPLLFGGIRARLDAGRRERFNSAMLIDADGMIRSAYDKSFLIPFAEFVPFADRFAAWSRIAPTLSHFRAGVEPTALRLGQWRIATPICYETIRPAYVRKLVRRTHAHLLVSLTNDGWFGDSPEPRLHLALTRFRAIEHRRYLVRATNTGISAIVDPVGRVVAKTEIFQATSLTYPVRMLEGLTIYEELGDWPGYLAATVLILVFALRRHGVRS
ncbi:MAG: apolipoprotein N-acyltransferase [Myxococcales bacterium]|jgi:apolipoprotein N-acyltransferase